MKKRLLFTVLIMNTFIYAQKNYQIEINGETMDISLDENFEATFENKTLNIKVSLKDTLTYSDDYLSFNYPKDYKISKTKIDEGIEQLVLMTGEGSGFIIQEYGTMNPTMLNELMLNEVTKESVNYGFELKREDYIKSLNNGLELKINRAYLTYKDEVNIYEITSIGLKDEGVLLMSMEMNDKDNSDGKQLIDMVWNSLSLH